MHDPRLIKNAILRKLGLEGGCERYLFFHENGKHSGKLVRSGAGWSRVSVCRCYRDKMSQEKRRLTK